MKICHHKTNYYCQSINHCGIKFYSLVPNDIINSSSFYLFKNKRGPESNISFDF